MGFWPDKKLVPPPKKGRFCIIEEMEEEKQLEVYRGQEGEVVFNVDVEGGTIWATEAQIAELFGVDRSVINRHLRNIYNTGELEMERTCVKNAQVRYEGKRKVIRQTRRFNLDAIISVGYRVNSKKATDFRIWATGILRNYVVEGVAINQRRLEELDRKKLEEIEGTLGVVRRLIARNELDAGEAKGVLEVISRYAKSFKTLEEYDEGRIVFKKAPRPKKELSVELAKEAIADLKKSIGGGELFGKPRGGSFEGSMGAIYQTFDGEDVYKTVADKAGNLLYLIIKDHPFYDGNKRIGALLFIVFLTINEFHLTEGGETKISDRALTAITLMIAESEPEEKKLVVGIICKMLEG